MDDMSVSLQHVMCHFVATQSDMESLSLSLQMLRMSTGHMEGDLQPLYLLLTDCYIYLLRKGKCLSGLFGSKGRKIPS